MSLSYRRNAKAASAEVIRINEWLEPCIARRTQLPTHLRQRLDQHHTEFPTVEDAQAFFYECKHHWQERQQARIAVKKAMIARVTALAAASEAIGCDRTRLRQHPKSRGAEREAARAKGRDDTQRAQRRRRTDLVLKRRRAAAEAARKAREEEEERRVAAVEAARKAREEEVERRAAVAEAALKALEEKWERCVVTAKATRKAREEEVERRAAVTVEAAWRAREEEVERRATTTTAAQKAAVVISALFRCHLVNAQAKHVGAEVALDSEHEEDPLFSMSADTLLEPSSRPTESSEDTSGNVIRKMSASRYQRQLECNLDGPYYTHRRELASTLDGPYWAVVGDIRGFRKRRQPVLFNPVA
jgi:hypothetical protein